jgi:hypothetical protein
MTQIVPGAEIEAIVGVQRHPTRHYARAVSDEQMVYILHSALCKASTLDLRECPFSLALDNGIEADDWSDVVDQPVRVTINRDARLIPVVPGMRLAP